MLAVNPVVLRYVWDFLSAEYSDIHLALQSHAVEAQFNNWVLHFVTDELDRRIYEHWDFFRTLAQPEIPGRLQGVLDLLNMRCVNRVLLLQWSTLLKVKGVALYDLICASRPVQIPAVFVDFRHILRGKRRNIERCAFRNGGLREHQRERLCRWRLLEASFGELMSVNEERLQTWNSLHHQKIPVYNRLFKGKEFSWKQCVKRWGYYYEISSLYEWFVQLEKVN